MELNEVRLKAMRAAHHAYCSDTGCFDGDDISNTQINAALLLIEALGYQQACEEAALRFCPPGTAYNQSCGEEAEFLINGKKKKVRRAICGSHLMLEEANMKVRILERDLQDEQAKRTGVSTQGASVHSTEETSTQTTQDENEATSDKTP